MYALNLSADGRVLSATLESFAAQGQPLVEALPEGDISDYLYRDGAFVYDPTPQPSPEPARELSLAERIRDLEIAVCELTEGTA